MSVPSDQTECPPLEKVDKSKLFVADAPCGGKVDEVHGPGTRVTLTRQPFNDLYEACCYAAEVFKEDPDACSPGRPYYERGVELRAALNVQASGSPALGAARGTAWANAGVAEHESIAAFARLALELLRFAAPLELLRAAHQAAIDEVTHAEICFRLAERFGSARVTAGPFPLPSEIALASDLASLAAACAREGCLAETLGAHVAGVAAARAPDPDVRDALERIVADETRHAVLSFRIVAWALQVGGDAVRSAVTAAFDEPWPKLDVHELALRSSVEALVLARAAEQGAREVLEPARARLLAAPAS